VRTLSELWGAPAPAAASEKHAADHR
jgi:hypothetical protein